MKIFEKVNGKKLDVRYEETGYHFHMTYLSESELKWEAQFDVPEGEDSVGIEKYETYKIAEGIYNINWIEEAGLTVSQILDFNTNSVYAYLTWEEEGARGNRGSLLQKGKFDLL